MLSFSSLYWDLIKFPYFVDTIEREDRRWKQAQRQGEDRVTLVITLLFLGVFGLKSKEIRIDDLGSQLCIELGNGKDQWKKIS
jgi:hypothetical protein